MKQAQVTMFIMVGFLILIVGAAVFSVIFGLKIPFVPDVDKDSNMLKSAVVGCLEMKANEWLFVHGMYSAQYGADANTFGLNQNSITMPDVEAAERELEAFLSEQLSVCIDFDTQGYVFDTSDARFLVDIGSDVVRVG